jgi:Aconitase A
MIPSDFVGTLPGWITAGSLVTLLGFLLRNQVANRKIGVDRLALDNAAAATIGNLYAEEVKALRLRLDENSKAFRAQLTEVEERYKELLKDSDRRHDECERERVKLHNEVAVLRKEIDGLVRVITQASIDRVIMLGDEVPEHIREAAQRAANFIAVEQDKTNE